ncbi:unnamed protein product [Lactuca saligna]|uniref:Major facilitator superfamily (MFS) profile domain-containing protein n=1 Tax=Lactuca saligna TaxID=75948 RepID=A0AA35Z367_LACSI|nr:unnamed protein product [Lactuca saligna]
MEDTATNSTHLSSKNKEKDAKLRFHNCPGCKIDRLKEERTGLPYAHLSYIWLVSLCTALPISSLYPFIYFMIRDFNIATQEEDIGYYAGFVGSSFMIGRALTSLFWGVLADRYGRKPIILIGTFSVFIFNTMFGLSSSFWMAISSRFLLGCFNSLLGTIRTYASEVCHEEYQALALSIVSTSRGIGLIIGPAIGGFFAQPAEKYPQFFSENSLFGRFPYFLPCLIISIYSLAVFISSWWLPETLHKHGNASEVEASESLLGQNEEIAYTEIFSLWAVSDKSYGGLSFSSQDVGEILAISGFGLLLFQLLLYPLIEKLLGPLTVTRLSAVISIPILSTYPYIATLSGFSLLLAVNCASLIRNFLSVSLVTGLFILLNKSVGQHERGAANGISMTAMSVSKAFGPAGAGALFSFAQKRQVAAILPGDQLVFFTLNILQFVGLVLTFKPFMAQPDA